VGTHFVVRTCVDRLAGDGQHTIADEMKEVPIQGLHRIQVRDDRGQIGEAVLEIRYRRIRVLPPIGKQNQYPDLNLTVIHAQERGKPRLAHLLADDDQPCDPQRFTRTGFYQP
jgi:hypothetical protein